MDAKTKTSENNNKIEQTEKCERLETVATNVLFIFMIILTITGTGYMGMMLQEHISKFQLIKPDYKVPKFSDFYITLLAIPFMSVKIFLKSFSKL